MLDLEKKSSEKIIKKALNNLPYEAKFLVKDIDCVNKTVYFFDYNPQLDSYVFFRKNELEEVEMYVINDKGRGYDIPGYEPFEIEKMSTENIILSCARFNGKLNDYAYNGKAEKDYILERLTKLEKIK